jgi:hypothetical protein
MATTATAAIDTGAPQWKEDARTVRKSFQGDNLVGVRGEIKSPRWQDFTGALVGLFAGEHPGAPNASTNKHLDLSGLRVDGWIRSRDGWPW